DEHFDAKRLQYAVRRTAVVITAAVVIQNRDILSGAFRETDAYAERMQAGRILLGQVRDLLEGEQIQHLLFRHQSVMTTAVHGGAGLHTHIAALAVLIGVLKQIQPTHHPPTVEARLMQAYLFLVEMRLGDEIGRTHQLASKIVVLDERLELASHAAHSI